MSNTVLTSKNTFLDGLVMDFSPDNTQSSTLTSALNATLLTFNGNEMSLQNDMGNGRVETAYLPEGYIPVGTCEFGDIIYIVSYNPLTNKSQIGCFPSPERNISSEETGGMDLTLYTTDFQYLELDLKTNELKPTGELKSSSVKKILYDKSLNPGDKYIIYTVDSKFPSSTTDLGNTDHIYGYFPRLFRVHVIAIEDGGKINYLDSTVKWYNDYFINSSKNNSLDKPDIDSYRSLISSGYSVFLSKVSGKLALLIELEKITGFNVTYDVYRSSQSYINESEGIEYKNYDIYWNLSWSTDDNNINPSYIVLTKSEWKGKSIEDGGKIYVNNGTEGGSKTINITEITETPICYPNDGYYWDTISLKYDLSDENITYEDFKSRGSYQALLNSFILDVQKQDAYTNLTLVNVTQKREEHGYPDLGKYYINLKSIKDNKYYTYDSSGKEKEITSLDITDDIVNNYFKSSIYKKFSLFSIPVKLTVGDKLYIPDISNLVYNYEITPAMPYGLLKEYSLEGFIDFSKIGTGEISVSKWKYYNTENMSTLGIGFDIYPEPNKGVYEVVLEFCDNLGIAAAYHLTNLNSYSGSFTEYIPLNGATQSYKLNNKDRNDKTFIHAGAKSDTGLIGLDDAGKPIQLVLKEDGKYYNKQDDTEYVGDRYDDDSGILYSNFLYLVKIVIKYSSLNALGEYDKSTDNDWKYFYRWYWTNNMFNEYYYNTSDFDLLEFNLNLDCNALYSKSDDYTYLQADYIAPQKVETDLNKSISSTVLRIHGNINTSIEAGLYNTYNTFSLSENAKQSVSYKIYLGNKYIKSDNASVLQSEDGNYNIPDGIYPKSSTEYDESKFSKTLLDLFEMEGEGSGVEIYDDYNNYPNLFEVNISSTPDSTKTDTEDLEYLNYEGETVTIKTPTCIYGDNIDSIYKNDGSFLLQTNLFHFSKYCNVYNYKNTTLSAIYPLVYTELDLFNYGMSLYNDHVIVNNIYGFIFALNRILKKYNVSENGNFIEGNYAYECKATGEGKFWTLFQKNKTSSLKWIWDLEGMDENFKNFLFNNGVFLLAIDEDFSSLGKRIDLSNTLSEDNFTNTFIETPNITGISMNHMLNFKEPMGDSSAGYNSKWQILDRDDLFYNTVFILGYYSDLDSQPHILNDWFLLVYLKLQSVNYFTLNLLYGSLNLEPSEEYVGDYIASLFFNIYVIKGSENKLITNYLNTLYLSLHLSLYTQDIIYNLSCNTLNNNNILIGLFKYDDYIKVLALNNEIVDNDGNIIETVNTYNINVNISSCLKNIPLQFKVDYINPSFSQFIDNPNAIIYSVYNDPTLKYILNLLDNLLYQLNDFLTLEPLNQSFKINYFDSILKDNNSLKVEYNNTSEQNECLFKMITYSNGLQLSTVRRDTNNGFYSIGIKEKLLNGAYYKLFGIRDLVRDENFIPKFRLLN